MRLSPTHKLILVLIFLTAISFVIKHVQEPNARYAFPDNAFNLNHELPALGVIRPVVNELPELVTPPKFNPSLREAGRADVPIPEPKPERQHVFWSEDLSELCFDERLCLALTAYHEDRFVEADTPEQWAALEVRIAAIMYVVLNRRDCPPAVDPACKHDTIATVVLQKPRQFSFVDDGQSIVPDLSAPLDAKAFVLAGEVAEQVLSGEIEDPTRGALLFHRDNVSPTWRLSDEVELAGVWGRHRFYVHINWRS